MKRFLGWLSLATVGFLLLKLQLTTMAHPVTTQQQVDFGIIIPRVALVSEKKMDAPANLIYSTDPQFSLDSQGHQYCAKGHRDLNIVLGELVGHMLAGYLQIPVPGYAIGQMTASSSPLFASAVVQDAIRDATPFIRRKKVSNLSALAKMIVLDVWLANDDRNIGNILARPCALGHGNVTVIAIDFEKSKAVTARSPLVEIPMLKPKALWPRGELGALCSGLVKLEDASLSDFKKISDEIIKEVVKSSCAAVGLNDESRISNIIHALVTRRDQIELLAKAEWN
jgi:hypothetical protein